MQTQIDIWREKKNLERLKNCEGCGTSYVSLLIPGGECVAK